MPRPSRSVFKDKYLSVRIILGGNEGYPAGTFIGLRESEWVRATPNGVRARLMLTSPGTPGEYAFAAVGAVVEWPGYLWMSPEFIGTELWLDDDGWLSPVRVGDHPQKVGLIVSADSAVLSTMM